MTEFEQKAEDIELVQENANPDALCDAFEGPWCIAALYQFLRVESPLALRNKLQHLVNSYPLCGTLIIADEGINGTIGGSQEGITAVHQLLIEEGFNDLEYKEAESKSKPFQRIKLKLKKEIVTLGVPVKPLERVGRYLDPEEWNELIQRDDVVLIDTRNDYECKVGTFRNAINPHTTSFAEFPDFVKSNPELIEAKKQKKRVAMFCTGGIRCEKSTSYMIQEGYDEVYHLKGGILKYLEETPVEKSLWNGECFVFDNRTCVTHGLKPGKSEICDACGWPVTPEEKTTKEYEYGVSCPNCIDKTTPKQKEGFRMRVKQQQLKLQRSKREAGVADLESPSKKQKSLSEIDHKSATVQVQHSS